MILCAAGMVVAGEDTAHEEAIKEQQREGYAQSACDYDPSNRAFDDILPHLLNM